jgi:DNA-binding CsgD family transcriptional regulator
MQAATPLPMALRQVSERLKADLAAITRVDHADRGRDMHRPAKIVAFDRWANLADEIGGFRVSYAAATCGSYVWSAKPGSIWHARRSDFDHDLGLRAPLQQRRLNETVVIPLERHATSGDFLEMHFAEPLETVALDRLGVIAATLAESWRTRAFGMLQNNVLATQHNAPGRAARDPSAAILGTENAFGLSRSEYRVCLLLSRGLNNASLLDELSISVSTLRTHLRNIYAKTGAASQAELVQSLFVPSAGAGRVNHSSHVA